MTIFKLTYLQVVKKKIFSNLGPQPCTQAEPLAKVGTNKTSPTTTTTVFATAQIKMRTAKTTRNDNRRRWALGVSQSVIKWPRNKRLVVRKLR